MALGSATAQRRRGHSARCEREFVEALFAVVEAEFGLLEECGKARSSQPVELLMTAFGIVPEAFDAVDVNAVLNIDGAVALPVFVDAVMPGEAGLDQPVIAAKPVGDDLGRQLDLPLDDGHECCFRTVFHDLTMHRPAALQDPEHRRLVRIAAPRVAAGAITRARHPPTTSAATPPEPPEPPPICRPYRCRTRSRAGPRRSAIRSCRSLPPAAPLPIRHSPAP